MQLLGCQFNRKARPDDPFGQEREGIAKTKRLEKEY